ncbi:MAG: 16S rRNA pseudouridine(516) synthase [Clostridia bacterium]
MTQKLRLDKLLVATGEITITTAKTALGAVLVSVSGVFVNSADTKAAAEEIAIDGAAIEYNEFHYIMLNKPSGYLSATEDKHCATVLELLPEKYKKIGLFPAGRLDKDAEGFLLLTNDGVLAHGLMSPRRHVDKIYEVNVDGLLDETDISAMQDGVTIDGDYVCMPARLEIISASNESHANITVMEGRFHQVKKMFLSRNKCVKYLKRISIGGVKLDLSLQLGDFRELTKNEISTLKACAKM